MRAASIVVLSAILAVVAGDLASYNPVGEPFFNPSVVSNLKLGEMVSSTITNQTDYAEFFWVWIPSYVSEVTYSLNLTNGGTNECDSYVEAEIFTSEDSQSFPCYYTSTSSSVCDDYDTYLYSYGSTDSQVVNLYYNLRPGRYHYITVYNEYSGYNCQYNLWAEVTQSCPNTSVPLFVDYSNFTCSSFYNYTVNSQNVYGVLNNSNAVDVYGVNVPANVSRIWAFVSTPDSYDMYLTLTKDYASYDYYNADQSTDYGYQNSTNSLYNFEISYTQPQAGWYYFTLFPYTTVPIHYNITIGWTYCGGSSAGLGDWGTDVYIPAITYTIPDCNVPIVQSLNITTQSAWTFTVPRYNYTTMENYAAVYATLAVPWGTTGYVNLTCNTTDTNSYSRVVLSKNYLADCYYYDYSFYCDYVGQTSSSGEYFFLISQDLFTGGQWNLGICNDNEATGVTVVVSNNGVVSAPAAASPSATPSPGSAAASASPSPGADTGSATGGSGSSDAFSVIPAFAVVVLAALLSLLF